MARGLVLVAHPDDELYFAGAMMVNCTEIDWTVLVATHEPASVRGDQFQRALEALRRRGVTVDGKLLGLEDRGLVEDDYTDWAERISTAIWQGYRDFDVCYTHNPMGDYGHPHHVTVSSIAKTIMPRRAELCYFMYPGMTGVGWQHNGTYRWDHQYDGKEAMFLEAYDQHYEGLMQNLPMTSARLLTQGLETFTSAA